MKKLLFVLLALSVAFAFGCSESMTDQQGTNGPHGTAVDFSNMTYYANDFEGQYKYVDGVDEEFSVIDGRMTTYDRDDEVFYDNEALFFALSGLDCPNFGVAGAGDVDWSQPISFSIKARFGNDDDQLTMKLAAAQLDQDPNGAVVLIINQDLQALFGAGPYANAVLLSVATPLNGVGIIPVAAAPITGFAVDTDYTITVTIANDGAATNGPSITVTINGVPVISYDGATAACATQLVDAQQDGLLTALSGGAVTDDDPTAGDGNGLPVATWAQHWAGFVWGGSAANSTALMPCILDIAIGSDSELGPAIDSVAIDYR